MSDLFVEPKTLRALQVALRSMLAQAQDEHRKVTVSCRRALDTITSAILVRQAKVEQCQIALERCLNSERESCSMEAAALAEAQRRLAAAHIARKLATQAVADYQSQANASLKRLELDQSQGLRYLTAKLNKVAAVNAGGARTSSYGGVAGSGSANGAATSADQPVQNLPGLPAGCAMIPIELIDQAENPIKHPQDFGKGYSIEDLDYAFDLFESQILPGIASGADASSFSALDRANGVYGKRSLSDTFSGFLGGDAIKLELRPDGRYSITNGRHRIFVATQYGRTHVAAFMSGATP